MKAESLEPGSSLSYEACLKLAQHLQCTNSKQRFICLEIEIGLPICACHNNSCLGKMFGENNHKKEARMSFEMYDLFEASLP